MDKNLWTIPSMTSKTILFLDFDGVLHPKGVASDFGCFSRLPLLDALLLEAGLTHVEVVITSTWREAYSLPKLRGFFPVTLQSRVVDVTPQLDDTDSEYQRYREIRAWLNRHPEVEGWAELDDAKDEFPPHKGERAVFTDPHVGLTEDGVIALRRLLTK